MPAESPSAPGTPPPAASPPIPSRPGHPAGFPDAQGEDRLPALLGYALAVEAGTAGDAPEAGRHRAEAERLLQVWAFRHLHNHAERLRAEAAREALAGQRPPPGFVTLVAAVLVGLGLFAALVWVALGFGLTLPLPRG